MENHKCWLWPDHVIGKRESRQLREEHNAAINLLSAGGKLNQLEFVGSDFENAEKLAAAMGYEQTAYTSSSALIGLFCLPENPALPENRNKPHRGGCVIKTRELGFMFVQLAEDLGVEL